MSRLPHDVAYGAAAELARQAKLMESYGAHCLYVVDSAGALLMHEVAERFRAFQDTLNRKRSWECTRTTIFLGCREHDCGD